MTAQAPHNLPIQLTSFIGREQELAELSRLLGNTRLLTLTGAGGSGKTRLALEVAGEQRERFAGGAWLVELASLADPALIPATVATALGVHEEQNRPVLATLLEWLQDRQLLLILDNCEHLIAACAGFADAVLHAGRETRILATSREALGITGESAYQVPALQTPGATQALGPEQLEQYAAARLFVERATQALASFRLSTANAPAVALICRRLDGMPLAIELAAARVRALHVEQIAARLDDRFRLLTGGSRTALPRQQTLRGTLDWSHELLAPAERVLLRRLSIFAGGWTLEAAEEITKYDPSATPAEGLGGRMKHEAILPSSFILHPSDVLDLLTHLVDKSLVQLDEQAAEPRYRMLETIRQYGREKLVDAGEVEPLRDRHLDYYRRLGERAWLDEWKRFEWNRRLEPELDNLRAALEHACERDPEAARLLAGSLYHYWVPSAHSQEGGRWYDRVLGPAPRETTRGMAFALLGAGWVSAYLLALDDAESYLQHSIAMWRTLDDDAMLARTLDRLCFVKIHQGNSEAACAIYEEHESLFRQAAGPAVYAGGLIWWAHALVSARSDYVTARTLLEESQVITRRLNDRDGIASIACTLGYLATQEGDLPAARRYMEQSLAESREVSGERALSKGRLADVAYLQGDYAEARRGHEEALATFRSIGDVAHMAHIAISLGYVAVGQEELAEAESLFAEALAIARQGQFQLSLARCLGGYAHLRLAQGNAAQAARLMGSAIVATHTRTSHIPADRIKHERTVAALRAQLGETRFAELAAEGHAWSLEQALAEAGRAAPSEPAAPAAPTKTSKEALGGLTAREREVAALLARGESSRAIAAQLVLSERTVENHTANILSKLGFRSRTQVAAWALQAGLTKNPT